jgi:homoserine kinase
LIPGLDEVLALDTPGLFGIALSGAGPTVFALGDPDKADRIGSAIVAVFDKHGVRSVFHKLGIDLKGRVQTPLWRN